MNPSGRDKGKGKALSMYLIVNKTEELRPYERIYVRAKLRVLNKFKFRNVERQSKQMIFIHIYAHINSYELLLMSAFYVIFL